MLRNIAFLNDFELRSKVRRPASAHHLLKCLLFAYPHSWTQSNNRRRGHFKCVLKFQACSQKSIWQEHTTVCDVYVPLFAILISEALFVLYALCFLLKTFRYSRLHSFLGSPEDKRSCCGKSLSFWSLLHFGL